MHHFLSVHPSVGHWIKNHNSESIIDRRLTTQNSCLQMGMVFLLIANVKLYFYSFYSFGSMEEILSDPHSSPT